MRYATAAAFRQALEDRLKTEAAKSGLSIARLRKRVAFELFLRRLVAVAPDRWVLKGALALDFRFQATTRPTRDMDLGRDDSEDAAVRDLAAAQELALDDFFTFAAVRTDALDDADDFRAIRFHVTAELAGRVFDQFVLDVGFADSISSTPDEIETSDLLSFAGIERIRVPALPLPQHLAEKVHAYTRKYGASGRESNRPKDLVDILLIAGSEPLEAASLRKALEVTFGQREQQPLPSSLPPPRASWRRPTDAWPRRWKSSKISTRRSRSPPGFSIRSSPAVPTARGTLRARGGCNPGLPGEATSRWGVDGAGPSGNTGKGHGSLRRETERKPC